MTRGWLAEDAASSMAVHPTQLYFTSVGLVVLLLGLLWKRFERRPGETWLLCLAVWGLGNRLVESFRDPGYLTGAPHLAMSWLLIGAAAMAGFLFWRFTPLLQGNEHAGGVRPSSVGGVGLS